MLSLCAANETRTFRVDGKRIKLPVIGWVRMREAVRFSGPLKRATVSREAGRWFVSLMVETAHVQPVAQPEAVGGIDLGGSALATLSTGELIEGPIAHKALLGRLRRCNKALSRKRRGSQNFKKAKARLARLHVRIANVRKHATHKLTTRLTKIYRAIGIEDLNVRGMADNRCLASSIEAGRDHNAALNLASIAASSAVTACGGEPADVSRKARVKRSPVKQEENTAFPMAA
jgi:putative transposase